MTSFLAHNYKRDSFPTHSPLSHKKKIKHYSYVADDKIGKGYSSIVYKGLNDNTGETVAIKAIDMKGVKDSVSREMLDCQIEALTKLKHPNILRCFDVVRQASHCYIITEYCNEGDLSSLLKKKKRVSEGEVLKITKDMINGFVEIAEKNFLHRDLKLANIFINDGNALIADFGFAKKNVNPNEKEKYNVGSPLYMSPEALKKNMYSIKNDIWSIGIMIFELLHGETPWECRTEKELMDKMIRIPVKFRDSLNISTEMKSFIKKCLEINEEQRMSLSDLKQWNRNNTYESLQKNGFIYLPSVSLQKKPFSSKDDSNKPLSELTNRLSSRSQSSVPIASKAISKTNNNTSFNNSNKENQNLPRPEKILTKTDIEKNNNIVVIEINSFRLLFKILEKAKKYIPEEKELIYAFGNEVVRRVTNLMNVACPEENENKSIRQDYGLSDAETYFAEKTNPGIKKYKSVIREYFKKYTTEITIGALGRSVTVKQVIKEVLGRGKLMTQNLSNDELIMAYWMVEYSVLNKSVKKEYLDGVIDPKNITLSRDYLIQRIKEL